MADDDDVKVHLPKWAREAIKGAVIFFAGTGVTGATMFHSVSGDDVKAATKTAVTEAVSPVLDRLDQMEKRQTSMEVAQVNVTKQVEELRGRVQRLPTRNR